MSEIIRVLVVDDHPLIREGLRAVLELNEEIEIVGEAADGNEAVQLEASLHPDVILMDLLMPVLDGAQATIRILVQNPEARILVLSSLMEPAQVLPAVRAGALGYIAKNAPSHELLDAIRTLYQGGVHLPASLARHLLQARDSLPPAAERESQTLTMRELEILKLAALGLSNDEIAGKLIISPRTAGAHISHILDKLGLDNRTQAALYAVKMGWIKD